MTHEGETKQNIRNMHGTARKKSDASPAAKRKLKAVLGIWKTQQEHCACVHVCVRRRVGVQTCTVCVCVRVAQGGCGRAGVCAMCVWRGVGADVWCVNVCAVRWARTCGCVWVCVYGMGTDVRGVCVRTWRGRAGVCVCGVGWGVCGCVGCGGRRGWAHAGGVCACGVGWTRDVHVVLDLGFRPDIATGVLYS